MRVLAMDNPMTFITKDLVRFWMRDQADHAIFVRSGLTADNIEMANKAWSFSQKFIALDNAAQEEKTMPGGLLEKAEPLVNDFVLFQDELLKKQMMAQLLGTSYPVFRDHLVRESLYFLRLIGERPPQRDKPLDILYETLFWLRQFEEHAQFLFHWTDPYEKDNEEHGKEYEKKFHELLMRARLYVSMMTPQPVPEIPVGNGYGPTPPLSELEEPLPAIKHLVSQTRQLTLDYRKWLINLKPRVEKIEILGIIPSSFVDHQHREASYFLANLERILKGGDDAFEREYEEMPFLLDKQEQKLYHLLK